MEILSSDQIVDYFEIVNPQSICMLAWDIGECENSSPILYTFKNITDVYFHLKKEIGNSFCLYNRGETDRFTKSEPLVDIHDEMCIISFIMYKYDGVSYKISKKNFKDVKNVIMSFIK